MLTILRSSDVLLLTKALIEFSPRSSPPEAGRDSAQWDPGVQPLPSSASSPLAKSNDKTGSYHLKQHFPGTEADFFLITLNLLWKNMRRFTSALRVLTVLQIAPLSICPRRKVFTAANSWFHASPLFLCLFHLFCLQQQSCIQSSGTPD